MKLNKKGITLTEIIISIALISIVLIFLFSLLILVKDINDESKVNSTYLINKSLILKNIENDLRKASSLTIRNCSNGIKDIYSKYEENKYEDDGVTIKEYYFSTKDKPKEEVQKLKAGKCLELDYDNNTSTENARLGIYYYKNRNSYVISYIYGTTKATRELPDFEKYNVDASGNLKKDWERKNITLGTVVTGFATLKIPIIGSDGKDYSIIVSYYPKS